MVKRRVATRSQHPLEVYGALPLGLSVIGGTDNTDSEPASRSASDRRQYFFTDNIGINTEMLGVFRWFGDSTSSKASRSTRPRASSVHLFSTPSRALSLFARPVAHIAHFAPPL